MAKVVCENPNLKFSSLASEQYRVYVFPDGSTVRIENPTHLHVSKSGGHRVYDAQGISHYVNPGWIHLYWEVKDGCVAFDF